MIAMLSLIGSAALIAAILFYLFTDNALVESSLLVVGSVLLLIKSLLIGSLLGIIFYFILFYWGWTTLWPFISHPAPDAADDDEYFGL